MKMSLPFLLLVPTVMFLGIGFFLYFENRMDVAQIMMLSALITSMFALSTVFMFWYLATERKLEKLERQNKLISELYGVLQKNLKDKPVEKIIAVLSERIAAFSVVLEMMGKEHLRLLSKEQNNIKDKESLTQALLEIAKARSAVIDIGTKINSVHSEQDTRIEEKYNADRNSDEWT